MMRNNKESANALFAFSELQAYIYTSILYCLYPQALGPLSIQISMFHSTFGGFRSLFYAYNGGKKVIHYREKYIIQPQCRKKVGFYNILC